MRNDLKAFTKKLFVLSNGGKNNRKVFFRWWNRKKAIYGLIAATVLIARDSRAHVIYTIGKKLERVFWSFSFSSTTRPFKRLWPKKGSSADNSITHNFSNCCDNRFNKAHDDITPHAVDVNFVYFSFHSGDTPHCPHRRFHSPFAFSRDRSDSLFRFCRFYDKYWT